MLENHFTFPHIMVDGGVEEQNKTYKSSDDSWPEEYLVGNMSVPVETYSHAMEIWLPTQESYEKARKGVFEACVVHFDGIGEFMVPWTMKKWLREVGKFIEGYNALVEGLESEIIEKLKNRK